MAGTRDERRSFLKMKVLVLYPHYWPHYKAGGPVQSIYNLSGYFLDSASFFMVSKDRDIDGTLPQEKLFTDQWTTGPQQEQIYYTRIITLWLLFRVIRWVRPDVIMINGLFNLNTSLNGIILARLFGIKLVVSPRGMLQSWGLKRNQFIKNIYLKIVRFLLPTNVVWHATDVPEREDIFRVFGNSQNVSIASNIPRPADFTAKVKWRRQNEPIRLVFLSLINPNKNLHLVIDAVTSLEASFLLEIYGPIIDTQYWNRCKAMIVSDTNILYKGAIPPWEVQEILGNAHFFVLPTQGENFGHAIFDSLSCGTPVITTRNTPWQGLDEGHAGFYIDPINVEALKTVLLKVASMSSSEYESYRAGSSLYAKRYRDSKDYKFEYRFLFSS